MILRLIYLILLMLCGCIENPVTLTGEYYIQNGWLAFSSENYEEADIQFNTAIEIIDTGSVYHLLAYIGKGWTKMYSAKTKYDSIVVAESLVNQSGEYFDLALSLFPGLDSVLYNESDKMNLYAGVTFQRAYSAKQKSANEMHWETENIDLSDEIDSLYRQSIAYSFYLEPLFVFQYDTSLDYEDIILIRIANYILIGEIDNAVFYYKDYGFECNGNDIDEDSIIECLCITINDGSCPFD